MHEKAELYSSSPVVWEHFWVWMVLLSESMWKQLNFKNNKVLVEFWKFLISIHQWEQKSHKKAEYFKKYKS